MRPAGRSKPGGMPVMIAGWYTTGRDIVEPRLRYKKTASVQKRLQKSGTINH